MGCVANLRFALINGKRSNWIEAACGLRKGCPLSPYLFIICSELLSLLIQQRIQDKMLKGIRLFAHGPEISHLLFADDIILFAPATNRSACIIGEIMDKYCSISGQKINNAKSTVFFSKRMLRTRKVMQTKSE
ncbi:putative mitochondrial protein [Apostasia shenzhenica]|uniref:Putative mitochondrial protein n=1 Tax=Apostasia shenzhenica TaxID=1088818 RepID=A0A2I0BFB5_9ASPA|nr:putative mitochondrial protein [Apostasia shenzhenica]